MKYPKLTETEVSRQMIDTFLGYNHNLRISSGEMFDMKNMTSDYYPVLSPRKQRGIYANTSNPQGMIAKDSLCYVDGSDFYLNGYKVEGFELLTQCNTCKYRQSCPNYEEGKEKCPKQMVSMGAYVIILPDKKYINTADITDFGNIEASATIEGDVSFTLCKIDGNDYRVEYPPSATEPENPENLALWIDTSSEPHTLKQWSESSGMWVSIATTYVKIAATGIGELFEQYDGINISGLAGRDIGSAAELEGAAVVWEKGNDYIVVVGILDDSVSVTFSADSPLRITRTMPDMDFIIESENRLWGCRYGTNADGQIVNEIYASKLGDFKNWNCYMSLSTDSYAASCGTDGPFTGAITHLGYPLFFKENFVHKVYGNYPANFQIQTTALRGVQKGCERSLAIVGETLFYKARSSVCAYDGSLPIEMSAAFGEERYSNAVAGAHGNKYYISMVGTDGVWHLFVYDLAKGMWHKEDELCAEAFCDCRDELYCIADGKIITMLGSGETDTEPVEWMVQTGEIGLSYPDMKYISRLTVRMLLEEDTEVRFLAQYDFDENWEELFTMTGTSLHSFSIPIRPKRCDFMKLRIEGVGMAKIYSITKTIEQGSELS